MGCPDRCRARIAVAISALMVVVAFGSACAVFSPGLDRLSERCERLAEHTRKAEAAIDLARDRLGSLDAHLSESVRISHDRRAALADEIRREMAAVAARIPAPTKLPSPEVVRADIARLAEVDAALAVADRAIMRRLDAIEARLRAIEARKPPAPVVVEKTVRVEVPVAVPTPVYVYPARCR